MRGGSLLSTERKNCKLHRRPEYWVLKSLRHNILICHYFLTLCNHQMKVSPFMQWQEFKENYLVRFWSPVPSVIAAGILSAYYFGITGTLWANNVKLRLPQHRIRVFQAIVGGIIAGFGARLAMGCNLAAFFTGIPQFSLHAWFFALATAMGSWFGARFSMLPIFR